MAQILDEKQTGMYRLLILSDNIKAGNDIVSVMGKTFETVIVYDLPNAVAVKCDPDFPSMIGENVSFLSNLS